MPPAQPGDRLILLAEVQFGDPGKHAPEIDERVAGTEAQPLLNVSLGLLGPAEENFGVADLSVRVSQISIELQCPLAFPKALSRCDAASAKRQRLRNCQASATAFRHVVIAAARSARWVRAEMRWRCTLKVL